MTDSQNDATMFSNTLIMSLFVTPITMTLLSFITGNLSKQISFVVESLNSIIIKKESITIFVSTDTSMFSHIYGKCQKLGIFDNSEQYEITIKNEMIKANLHNHYTGEKNDPVMFPSGNSKKEKNAKCGSFRLENCKSLVEVSCTEINFRSTNCDNKEGLYFTITSYVPSVFIRFLLSVFGLTFFIYSMKEQKQELKEWLFSGYKDVETRKDVIQQISTWKPCPIMFYWKNTYVPVRKSHTIILPEGVYDNMLERCRDVLSLEYGKDCRETGTPWRIGMTLHGPPGGGKTSIVQALASDLGASLCILHISGLDDYKIMSLFSSLPCNEKGTILLIEDIDDCVGSCMRSCSADQNNNSKNNLGSNVSAATLFNVLDGIHGPSQCVIIITTNYIEKLDTAITREGRCGDLVIRIDPPGPKEIEKAFVLAYSTMYKRMMNRTHTTNKNVGSCYQNIHEFHDILRQKSREFAETVKNPISMSAVRSFLNAHRNDDDFDKVIQKASKEIRTL